MKPNEAAVLFYECLQCGLVIKHGTAATCPADQTELVPVYSYNDPLEGITINEKYLIISRCGSGASGTVYKAKHLALNKEVAVKFLHQHLLDDADKLSRFENEARTLSKLSHRSIVKVLDFGLTPQPFIVMEYATGTRLDHILEAVGPFPTRIAIKLFMQMCDGMTVVHELGLVHHDLKPANILVCKLETAEPEILILDFGTARLLDAENQKTGIMVGSPPYMSPEQCGGQPTDQRSDVYSMGCLMYEVLTGCRVFSATTTQEYLFKHLNQLPQPLSVVRPELKIPEELDRLVCRSLSKQQEFRVQSMAALAEGLRSVPQHIQEARPSEKDRPAGSPLALAWPGLIPASITALILAFWANTDLYDEYIRVVSIYRLYACVVLTAFCYFYSALCLRKVRRVAGTEKPRIFAELLVCAPLALVLATVLSFAAERLMGAAARGLLALLLLATLWSAIYIFYKRTLHWQPATGLLLICTLLQEAYPSSGETFIALFSYQFIVLFAMRCQTEEKWSPKSMCRFLSLAIIATSAVSLFSSLSFNALRRSERQLQTQINHSPRNASWFIEQAAHYVETDQYTLAFDYASKALELDSQSLRAWQMKLAAASEIYRYADAMECTRRILALAPTDFNTQFEGGELCEKLGKIKSALAQYEVSLKLARTGEEKAKGRTGCAKELLRLGNTEQALQEAQQALKDNNRYGEAWLAKANAQLLSKDYDGALKSCQALPSFGRLTSDAGCIKALVLAQQGKIDLALKTLQESTTAPLSTKELLTKSLILSKAGNYKEALALATNVRNQQEITSETIIGDTYFTLAQISFDAQNLADARKYAIDSIALASDMAERTALLASIDRSLEESTRAKSEKSVQRSVPESKKND